MIIELLKQRTSNSNICLAAVVRDEKIYSGTSVSHMVAGGVKPGKSTVFLRNEFTQSNIHPSL